MNLTSSDTTKQIMDEWFLEIDNKSRSISNNDHQTNQFIKKNNFVDTSANRNRKIWQHISALLAASYDYNLWGASLCN
jgi:hypothetical protein